MQILDFSESRDHKMTITVKMVTKKACLGRDAILPIPQFTL